MSRNTSAGLKTELESQSITTLLLVKLGFDSGIQRYHTGVVNIEYDDDGGGPYTYVGVGEIGSIEKIEESLANKAHGLSLSLSGVDTNQLNLVVSEDYQGRPVDIFIAYYDVNTCQVVEAHPVFSGGMDTITISRGDSGNMVLTVEHEAAQFDKAKVFRATDEDHRKTHPTDFFFNQVSSIAEKEIVWGNIEWTGRGNAPGDYTGLGGGIGNRRRPNERQG